jgi:DivIVA domain-containing protein
VGTLLLYAVLAILVAIAIVALLLVFLPAGPVVRPVVAADAIPDGLPTTGALVAEDIPRIRLPIALRGYRMAEVDAVLDRLAAELEIRDAQLAERDQRLAGTGPGRDGDTAGAEADAASAGADDHADDSGSVEADAASEGSDRLGR